MTEKLALSWSGGKDACMALHELTKQGKEVAVLITTVPQEMGRTFAHGEKTEMIALQGEALNIPVYFIHCTYDGYKEHFVDALYHLKEKYGITGVAFGDLYIEGHREWGMEVAKEAGVKPYYPLWTTEDKALASLKKFIDSGYQAKVIRIRKDSLEPEWLGRTLDESFLKDIEMKGVCPMGEAGEYHTFVYDGPLFKQKIELSQEKTLSQEQSQKLEFGSFKLV